MIVEQRLRAVEKVVSAMVVMMVVVVVVMLAGVSGDSHGWDHDVCSPGDDDPGSSKPNLPESFGLRVEANIFNKNTTTTMQEFYNYDTNIAAVKQTAAGKEEYFFYMYSTNQFLRVMTDSNGGKICVKQDLSKSPNNEMFGIKVTNSTSDRVYSVYGALHFGGDNIHEKYEGKETVRGIPCNKWFSCQYWKEMDATSNVTWYFSDESQWTSISGYTAPIRCHVTGTRWKNATYSYTYDHLYEFFDFHADITGADVHFEVPRNTYCFDEKNTKPIPQMPFAYTFNLETLDLLHNTIGFTREEYDNKTQLMRYMFRDAPQANSTYGTRLMSQIHDFNTGLSYKLDILQSQCTVTPIARNEFDDINLRGVDVRMRGPNEFLYLNYNFVYQGVHKVRGIDCDTWTTVRSDYPHEAKGSRNPISTWSMYFATSDWLSRMGFQEKSVMPVMLEFVSNDKVEPFHKIMHFYEYNAQEPEFLSWDITPCYGVKHSRNFVFLVPGTYQSVVGNNIKLFKYLVILSLQDVLKISPLRVTHLDIQPAGANTVVTMELLDKVQVTGDVARPVQERSLDEVYNDLASRVNSSQMQILVPSPQAGKVHFLFKPVTVMPAGPQYQFQKFVGGRLKHQPSVNIYISSSWGYSGGAMGGMAVGMLVLGALVGFGIMFLIFRIRNGGLSGTTINMERFNNESTD